MLFTIIPMDASRHDKDDGAECIKAKPSRSSFPASTRSRASSACCAHAGFRRRGDRGGQRLHRPHLGGGRGARRAGDPRRCARLRPQLQARLRRRHRRPDRHAGRRSQLSVGCDFLPAGSLPAPGGRFPERLALSGARPAGHEPQAPVRQPGALAGHVGAVFPLGARFAIRHVGLPAIHSEGHAAGVRRHGVLRRDQDRSAEESARPLRRDLDHVFVAAGGEEAESLAGRLPQPAGSWSRSGCPRRKP